MHISRVRLLPLSDRKLAVTRPCGGKSTLVLNSEIWQTGRLAELWGESQVYEPAYRGTSPEVFVIAHEFAHALVNTWRNRGLRAWSQLQEACFSLWQLGDKVSRYAYVSQPEEAFADAFACWWTGRGFEQLADILDA